MGVQEPVADRGRELAAVIALDQRHHHVERGDAARAGDAVAVDLEQRRHHLDIGEGLAEGRQMLPMQRRAALIEQPGLGEDVGPAGDAADGDALRARRLSQANTLLSSKVAGLPPAQTNIMSAVAIACRFRNRG